MKRSILLADDSATIRKVVELTFVDTEFHVESAGSGEEALNKLELLRPDVVLADVVMPEPTGYEICRRIKASDRPVPVLLLAGTFESFDHEKARACGADGCLLKPFESRTLFERVTSLIAGREALSRSGLEPLDTEAAEPVAELEPAGESAATVPITVVPEEAHGTADAGPIAGDEELLAGLGPGTIDAIARAVVRRLSEDVVRQIAREVIPRVAETVVRERIRELEGEDS